ncbi:unnamed protein product [Phytophthora fragariaefolia]|uniref:Unnamed protein product n=1 Tax=Phytophthora fragariaefolia TaxID=1490495 RepID=A0A9W6YAZ7_9STRA|nr:unnamed protein product [Phytophthora fragariaefolia]
MARGRKLPAAQQLMIVTPTNSSSNGESRPSGDKTLRLEDGDICEGGNGEDKSESSVDEFENSSSSDDEADDDRDEGFEYASDSSEALQEILDVTRENAAWIYVNKSLPN